MADYSSLLARLASFESSNSGWQSEADELEATREESETEIKSAASAIAQRIGVLSPRIENLTTSHSSFVTQSASDLDRLYRATNDQVTVCVDSLIALFDLFSSLPNLQSDAQAIPDLLKTSEKNLLQALNDTDGAVQTAQVAFARQCNEAADSYRSELEATVKSIDNFKTLLADAAQKIDTQITRTIPESLTDARNAVKATMTATSQRVILDVRDHAMQAISAVDTDMQHAISEAINALSTTIEQFVSGVAGGSGAVDERARALISAVEDIMQLIPQVVQDAVEVPPRVAAKLATFGLFS